MSEHSKPTRACAVGPLTCTPPGPGGERPRPTSRKRRPVAQLPQTSCLVDKGLQNHGKEIPRRVE
eukprot:10638004-Alexandrium_andersonii.AAC.1